MTLISLTEDKLATIYRVDTTMKMPNPRGQVEAPFWISESEKNHIRKGQHWVKGALLDLWFLQGKKSTK